MDPVSMALGAAGVLANAMDPADPNAPPPAQAAGGGLDRKSFLLMFSAIRASSPVSWDRVKPVYLENMKTFADPNNQSTLDELGVPSDPVQRKMVLSIVAITCAASGVVDQAALFGRLKGNFRLLQTPVWGNFLGW